tara:strand:+ start:3464 stop:3703 length:240 start_codon:yes stop_codon:yes gene_type:complete
VRLSTEQAEAITALMNKPEFGHLHSAILTYRDEVIELTMMGPVDGVETHRGMARALTELLRAIGRAPNQVSKSKPKEQH